MGIPVKQSDPQITIQGMSYALTVFTSDLGIFQVIVAVNQGSEWYQIGSPYQDTTRPGDFFYPQSLNDIRTKGGTAGFFSWLKDRINFALAARPGALSLLQLSDTANPVIAEPTDQTSAQSAIIAMVNSMRFAVPYPTISSKMRADYDGYWTPASDGSSLQWANGSLTKLGVNLALYADPSGTLVALSPVSDLNAIAKAAPGIAAKWKADYGFIPI